ncbi:hypothetical protein AMTRI_Chr08g166690 [Amborella trichopoda]|uniref:Protein kinase domain-containing protein n=1 Tax=Amborella trichopoda TaxID=13333 RepID=W1PC27_AMBTC|nr:dual specificity tyrosine-phosphorylation-regulated kinase 4 [Amborella trichopoda]ERN05239.1 hypothetical protein AMTR_s00007p00085450 [Amborella trichopoda]|eukprot:XP_006843564.1 dual specificity tyrosine-phosphorylation-regulated kinase 4 [Amborella trichopoda]
MAVANLKGVLEFLKQNGFREAESAVREELLRRENGGFSESKELTKLPVVRIHLGRKSSSKDNDNLPCSSDSAGFLSTGSSADFGPAWDIVSSEKRNPYSFSANQEGLLDSSSDGDSEFCTACDGYDSLSDTYTDPLCPLWDSDSFYDDNRIVGLKEPMPNENFLVPQDIMSHPSEDKFVTVEKIESSEPCRNECKNSASSLSNHRNHTRMAIHSLHADLVEPEACENGFFGEGLEDNSIREHRGWCFSVHDECEMDPGLDPAIEGYRCSVPLCGCCNGIEEICGDMSEVLEYDLTEKESVNEDLDKSHEGIVVPPFEDSLQKPYPSSTVRSSSTSSQNSKRSLRNIVKTGIDDEAFSQEMVRMCHDPGTIGDIMEETTADIFQEPGNPSDEYEIFNLRIIHRKNRTGFEESKDFPIVLNTLIAGRYYVTEYLGSAAFSKVVQAQDLQSGMDVCVKIIKNDKDYFDQSLDEIKLLKFVNKHDPADRYHILRLYDYFYCQEHLFIVSELLRANLFEFQKFNLDSGEDPYFTLPRLQAITRQCLEALEFLHHLGIIHCDLKPENILMKSYSRCEVKVIDLGSSCFETDNLCLYVQSRSYRAPEVILGVPYDQKIDLWSLGCILAELSSGDVLFPNDSLVMILARMIGMLGPIDMEMLEMGQETHKYFTKNYNLYHKNEETNQLEHIIPVESLLSDHLVVADDQFIEFISELLQVNPQRRPTAREALEHPWLSCFYGPVSY